MPDDEQPDAPKGRSFWSGTISFGLVSIPVNLFSGRRPYRAPLRMLAPDGTPLMRRYRCPEHGTWVEGEELIRGYEVADGEFVVVSDEELEALAPRRSKEIDLRLFVDRSELDPILFERAYFLAPGSESTKAYRLLAGIMERTGKAGIATFVMRDREHLVAILSERGILRAETMRFVDELRNPADVDLPAELEADEEKVLGIREKIRELEGSGLEEDELLDRHWQRILEVAEQKHRRGEDVILPEVARAAEEEGEVIDLMEVLKRSLGRGEPAARSGAERGDALEERSKSELYERARQLDIPGRSSMSKGELIEALRRAG